MKSGIYKITNTLTGRFYIGSTNNFDKRWRAHKRSLKTNGHNRYIQHDSDLFGIKSFKFEVIECVEPDDYLLLEVEQKYLNMYWDNGNKCYNDSKIAGSPPKDGRGMRGKKHSDQTKAKIGAANKISQLGKKHTEITKARMSKSGKGKRIGRVLSPEQKAKLSIANLGKQLGHKHNLGRKHTDESKAKIGEKSKGNQYRLGWTGQSHNNTSGYIGVCYDKNRQKWTARYGRKNLGRFDTKEQAYIARLIEEEIQKI